jgi:hypothetical protein
MSAALYRQAYVERLMRLLFQMPHKHYLHFDGAEISGRFTGIQDAPAVQGAEVGDSLCKSRGTTAISPAC